MPFVMHIRRAAVFALGVCVGAAAVYLPNNMCKVAVFRVDDETVRVTPRTE